MEFLKLINIFNYVGILSKVILLWVAYHKIPFAFKVLLYKKANIYEVVLEKRTCS